MNFGIIELARVGAKWIDQLGVVSNNIANARTPGFKVERSYLETIGEDKDDRESAALPALALYVDYSQGMLEKTDNVLDMAIQGEGFFTLQTAEGITYTRKGNFTVDEAGRLITGGGGQVLGEAGPVVIMGGHVNVDSLGIVSVDGAQVAKLKIAAFDNPQGLVRLGGGSYADPGNAGYRRVAEPQVRSRYLESANVNTIKEMAEMINIQRSFESYQKAMQTIADLDRLSTGRVGKLV